MKWVTDELLFYGGLATVIAALILLIIYMVISRITFLHLKKKLDTEYGDAPEKKQ